MDYNPEILYFNCVCANELMHVSLLCAHKCGGQRTALALDVVPQVLSTFFFFFLLTVFH